MVWEGPETIGVWIVMVVTVVAIALQYRRWRRILKSMDKDELEAARRTALLRLVEETKNWPADEETTLEIDKMRGLIHVSQNPLGMLDIFIQEMLNPLNLDDHGVEEDEDDKVQPTDLANSRLRWADIATGEDLGPAVFGAPPNSGTAMAREIANPMDFTNSSDGSPQNYDSMTVRGRYYRYDSDNRCWVWENTLRFYDLARKTGTPNGTDDWIRDDAIEAIRPADYSPDMVMPEFGPPQAGDYMTFDYIDLMYTRELRSHTLYYQSGVGTWQNRDGRRHLVLSEADRLRGVYQDLAYEGELLIVETDANTTLQIVLDGTSYRLPEGTRIYQRIHDAINITVVRDTFAPAPLPEEPDADALSLGHAVVNFLSNATLENQFMNRALGIPFDRDIPARPTGLVYETKPKPPADQKVRRNIHRGE